jgi:hypothetical protein
MNEAFRTLSTEERALLDRYTERVDAPDRPGSNERPPVWVTTKEYEAAKAVLDAYAAKVDEAGGDDGSAIAAQRAIGDAKAILGRVEGVEYDFVTHVEPPFILLGAYLKDASAEGSKKTLTDTSRRLAKALQVFRTEFDKRFREPLGLPAVQERFFVHLLLTREDDLRRVIRAGGFDATGDIPAYFSPDTKWAHVWLDPTKAAHAGGDLAHEAVHQLHWYYARDPKNKALNHFDEWNGLWFTEGWAEYVGGGLKYDPENGNTRFTAAPRRRVELLGRFKDQAIPLYPLRELGQFDNFDTLRRHGESAHRVATGDLNKLGEAALAVLVEPGSHVNLFYSQAWALAHFLNEYGNGKYRDKYLDLVRTALSGKVKPEKYRKDKAVNEKWGSAFDAFVDIMEIRGDDDWARLEREFAEHLPEALRKGA